MILVGMVPFGRESDGFSDHLINLFLVRWIIDPNIHIRLMISTIDHRSLFIAFPRINHLNHPFFKYKHKEYIDYYMD